MSFWSSPAATRCAPFALFIATLIAGSLFSAHAAAREWLVLARGGLVAVALAWYWRDYSELRRPPTTRPGHWLLAVLAGLVVFLAWIGLDQQWAKLPRPPGLNPLLPGGGIDWPTAAGRLAGLALVVPVMEELFWRSFLMRWLARHDFLAVEPRRVGARAFAATTVLFAVEHDRWLAGGIGGMAYGALYMLSGNLWVPILAHMLTNALLGAWILFTHSWELW